MRVIGVCLICPLGQVVEREDCAQSEGLVPFALRASDG